MKINDPHAGLIQRLQELGRQHMHEPQTHNQLGRVLQHQPRQLRVVLFAGSLNALGRRGMPLLVLEQVVVERGNARPLCALESEGVLAVRQDADDVHRELPRADLVDYGLQVCAIAGYEDRSSHWLFHYGGIIVIDSFSCSKSI